MDGAINSIGLKSLSGSVWWSTKKKAAARIPEIEETNTIFFVLFLLEHAESNRTCIK